VSRFLYRKNLRKVAKVGGSRVEMKIRVRRSEPVEQKLKFRLGKTYPGGTYWDRFDGTAWRALSALKTPIVNIDIVCLCTEINILDTALWMVSSGH
jgi:hypothetical protein